MNESVFLRARSVRLRSSRSLLRRRATVVHALCWGSCLAVFFATVLHTVGCSGDRSRRLTPQEALHYKRSLLLDHEGALGEDQIDAFGAHKATTKKGIDAVFDDMARAHSERQASERRLFLEQRGVGDESDGQEDDG